MNFLNLVKERYSVRAYLPQSIEKEKLDYILEAARWAPSAANKQAWKFYVLSGESLKSMHAAYDKDWFKQAPVCIAISMQHDMVWKRNAFDNKDHADVDASIAIEHIVLAAQEQGIGSCWICNFDPAVCQKVLGAGEQEEVIALIPLGYPDTSVLPRGTKRKIMSEIVVYKD